MHALTSKSNSKAYVSWASPYYWGNEKSYVLDALSSSWISGGPYVDKFEKQFANYCGSPAMVASSNGTTAIHMLYLALEIGRGDEVIVPGFGFMAAANMALHVGAKPVFCDVDPLTWCMTAAEARKCITPVTKAIVAIHTYGNMCDMDELLDLGAEFNIPVIEDAAEAIGSLYNGAMAGTIAKYGTYSFHATKTITTGEGGGVVTSDDAVAEKMRLYRSHGMGKTRYWHEVAGHNFRLTNMQAAIGCAQLEQIDTITAHRQKIYEDYRQHLLPLSAIKLQTFKPNVQPLVWAIAFKMEDSCGLGRDELINALDAEGIETRPGFYSANSLSHLYGRNSLPVSDRLAEKIISLPSSPPMQSFEIDEICKKLAMYI
jgi:perosamine synthetase